MFLIQKLWPKKQIDNFTKNWSFYPNSDMFLFYNYLMYRLVSSIVILGLILFSVFVMDINCWEFNENI